MLLPGKQGSCLENKALAQEFHVSVLICDEMESGLECDASYRFNYLFRLQFQWLAKFAHLIMAVCNSFSELLVGTLRSFPCFYDEYKIIAITIVLYFYSFSPLSRAVSLDYFTSVKYPAGLTRSWKNIDRH